MVAFYKNWQGGMSKAEVLQAAQREIRAEHPSPFFWASFVLSGDPGVGDSFTLPDAQESTTDEASTSDQTGTGICSSTGAVLLLAVAGLWIYLRRRNP